MVEKDIIVFEVLTSVVMNEWDDGKIARSQSVDEFDDKCDVLYSKINDESKGFDEDDTCGIDVGTLYSALLKLSCDFEMNESLKSSLTAAICSVMKGNTDDKIKAIEIWLKENSGTVLSINEMANVVKYVELNEAQLNANEEALDDDACLNTVGDYSDRLRHDYSYLSCPYRSDFSKWKAKIIQLHQDNSKPSDAKFNSSRTNTAASSWSHDDDSISADFLKMESIDWADEY